MDATGANPSTLLPPFLARMYVCAILCKPHCNTSVLEPFESEVLEGSGMEIVIAPGANP
jgi:hypothetical protein